MKQPNATFNICRIQRQPWIIRRWRSYLGRASGPVNSWLYSDPHSWNWQESSTCSPSLQIADTFMSFGHADMDLDCVKDGGQAAGANLKGQLYLEKQLKRGDVCPFVDTHSWEIVDKKDGWMDLQVGWSMEHPIPKVRKTMIWSPGSFQGKALLSRHLQQQSKQRETDATSSSHSDS